MNIYSRISSLISLGVLATFLTFLKTCESLTRSETEAVLLNVIDSVDRGLDFFMRQHKVLNLDAIIGTRLAEGQLKVFLNHVNKPGGPQLKPDIVQQISNIQSKADQVSNKATPYIKARQTQYYERIGRLLQSGFWSLDLASRDVDRDLIMKPIFRGEALHEEDSDNCLVELFGTGANKMPCKMSSKCWGRMTSPGYRGYSLSHEVLYLESAQLMGCFGADMLPVADSLNAGFCANLYSEAEDIAKQGLPEKRKDFFMEIPALCGMLGYKQFFREEWLRPMLNWQRGNGCWGLQPNSRVPHKRTKREEKILEDGCQCHRTAVALGALSQYIRYIAEYMQTLHS